MATPFTNIATGHEICILWTYISKTQRSIILKICEFIQHELPATWPNFG